LLLTKQQLGAHVMASDDPERYALTHIKIEPTGRVSATNGHIAVRVTPKHKMDEGEFPHVPGLSGAEPEQDVMIPTAMAEAAAKIVPKVKDQPLLSMARMLVGSRAMIGATDMETPKLVTEQREAQMVFDFAYPDVEPVLRPEGACLVTIRLRSDYLATIAKYAQSFAVVDSGLTLKVYGPDQAVRFEWQDDQHDVEGVLMPMRG